MSRVSLRSSSRAEWIKFRTVPSTLYGLIAMMVLTIGFGALINWAAESHYPRMRPQDVATFDPLAVSLFSIFFAQFVVGVLGALFITSEYSTGSIRTTLTAVPRRTLLVVSKFFVMAGALLVASEVTMFVTFLLDQALLRSGTNVPYDTLSTPGALRAVVFSGIYLMLLAGLGFALGLLLRKTTSAIVVFVVVLLVAPILIDILPSDWSGPITRYMPNKLGMGMLSSNQEPGTFSPFVCLIVMALYVFGLVAIGTYLMNRRDA